MQNKTAFPATIPYIPLMRLSFKISEERHTGLIHIIIQSYRLLFMIAFIHPDLYPLSEIHLAEDHNRPLKMPLVAWNPWEHMRHRDDVKKLNVSFPFGPIPYHFQVNICLNDFPRPIIWTCLE